MSLLQSISDFRGGIRPQPPDLFGSSLAPLEPARFIVKYKCATTSCGGHEQMVLDWEAGQGGRKWLRGCGDRDRGREAMMRKWSDEMLASDNDVHFYVGNQNARQWTFSILDFGASTSLFNATQILANSSRISLGAFGRSATMPPEDQIRAVMISAALPIAGIFARPCGLLGATRTCCSRMG